MATATATATIKKMYIDGQWCAAQDGKTVGIINPATEEVIVEMAFGSRADANAAIEAAGKAMVGWMKLTPYDRAKILKKTADLMRDRADRIAQTLDDGARQAARRSEGGGPALGRHVRMVRRGRQTRLRPDHPELGARQTARHLQASGRRRRRHQPVELPDHAAIAQDRAGVGGRLHHRLQARDADSA